MYSVWLSAAVGYVSYTSYLEFLECLCEIYPHLTTRLEKPSVSVTVCSVPPLNNDCTRNLKKRIPKCNSRTHGPDYRLLKSSTWKISSYALE